MSNNSIKIITFFFILVASITNAQDMHFSQFYEAPLLLNPALCGAFDGGVAANVNYRSQWSHVPGLAGFNTMDAAIQLHNLSKEADKYYISTGLSFYSDRVGEASMGNAGAALTFASGVYITDHSSISAGLQGGWSQYSVNPAALQWGSQYVNGDYDPNAYTGESTLKSTSSYGDFSAGLNYNYAERPANSSTTESPFKINAGLAFFHINQPDISYFSTNNASSKLFMRTSLHGSVTYRLKDSKVSLIPAFVYYNQGGANEFDLGLKVRYAMSEKSRITGFNKNIALDFGSYLRFNDALIFLVGITFETYSLGISYDVNVSQLSTATYGKGGIELSLKLLNLDNYAGQDTRIHHAM